HLLPAGVPGAGAAAGVRARLRHRRGGVAALAGLCDHPPVARVHAGRARFGHGASGMMVTWCFLDSPVGPLRLAAADDGLRRIEFPPPRPLSPPPGETWREGRHPLLDEAARQLRAYFDGT